MAILGCWNTRLTNGKLAKEEYDEVLRIPSSFIFFSIDIKNRNDKTQTRRTIPGTVSTSRAQLWAHCIS